MAGNPTLNVAVVSNEVAQKALQLMLDEIERLEAVIVEQASVITYQGDQVVRVRTAHAELAAQTAAKAEAGD